MREFEYQLCDVFTSRRLEGNQLAVFLDAAALSADEMQAIACEMNLSETTFVHRRDKDIERARGVRVHIFTTQEELPFAGHPTLGTAATIRHALADYANVETIVLDLNVGQVAVTFPEDKANGNARFGEMTQLDPMFGAAHDAAAIASLLGLRLEDLAEQAPQTVSTGMPFCITVLQSVEALARLRMESAASALYLRNSDAKFFYTLAPEGPGRWRARMQFYGGEDPATGSAAGCAISYLVRHGFARRENDCTFARALRSDARAIFTFLRISRMGKCAKFGLEAALFLLQKDSFSLNDAHGFNRHGGGNLQY